ncbi:RHS repeat-associated core domain-containing protein [Metasolibacillus meyeri]|uniref:RHS repeat-associated core domain-containing protein n=1 Tax=Metasolibacillus meyeri TaxID=1071052 RepID=A0AAW9NMC8_9BACL|nr:RHS repeat-associated core domain-containing protein [Metasolibacillus meyeri]MEC1180004.1 RHS repeat-associated core domain-containing protein [Metasolibacillus meyeri]
MINEKGEMYQFERDAKGQIEKEIGFDGMERTYERSPAGLVERILRPANRWTAYQHDALGNIIRTDYFDDTWETFGYDQNGLLTETANEQVTVKLERDISGQIIKEWQNDHWIASSYDELGNRTQITSSLGAKIDVARNLMGHVTQLTAAQKDQSQWAAQMQYNELGQEIERILPGNVLNQWQYDVTGRPTNHRVSSQGRHTRRRVYSWDINHQLHSVFNELTGVKTTYSYDEFSNLVSSSREHRFDFLYRSVDEVGNLYETQDKTDRVYGAGSRLLETREAKFAYDEEGNLIQKVESNGDMWQYAYFGNGMMSKVIRPDNTEVTFKYDALGRRIEKCSDEKTISFVWDGNTILHEYVSEKASTEVEEEKLITWVYDGESFTPSAKITGEGNYSIICDYLGTPVEAYDEQDFIPFRYQGQYEDIEIGLYYNRFRYYDPDQGIYTQQDPIGLNGGLVLYGYVHNTNTWVDVFGLRGNESYPTWMKKKSGFERHHIIPYHLWSTHPLLIKSGLNVNAAMNMMMLPRFQSKHPSKVTHSFFKLGTEHHNIYNRDMNDVLDEKYEIAKKEKWSTERMQNEVRDLQHGTRKKLNNRNTFKGCK